MRMTLHWFPVDLTEEWLGDDGGSCFFSKFRKVGDVLAVSSNIGITTGDFVLQITMTWKDFLDIPCHGQNILVIVEGLHPHCWAMRHLSKAYTRKNPSQPATIPKEAVGAEKSDKAPSVPSEWTAAVKSGSKSATPPPQLVLPASLIRGREEEENLRKMFGWSRVEKAINKAMAQSTPALPARMELPPPSPPSRSPPSSSTNPCKGAGQIYQIVIGVTMVFTHTFYRCPLVAHSGNMSASWLLISIPNILYPLISYAHRIMCRPHILG